MKNLLLFSSTCFALILSASSSAQIQPGLDPAFGNGDGYVISNVSMGDLKILADGKIIASGTALVRFLPDGGLDNSFGNAGVAPLSGSGVARQIGLQEGGKIVVSRVYTDIGFEDDKKYLTRYYIDGSIDQSFGYNGYSDSVADFGEPDKGMLIQPDGKILLITEDDANSMLQITRMTSEGLIDSSFGTNGIVLNALSLEDIYLFDAILQPDGKILAVGQYNTVNSALEIFVIRLLPDGSFDNSFNQTGVATVSGIEAPKAMVIQPDGKIVVIGNNILENPAPFYLVRFNMNGSRDWIFGNDGIAKIIWESGEMNRPSSLAIQSDGKIVVSGWVWYPEENTQKWGLARLDGNGQADSTFGQNGRLITSFRPGFSLCRKIALLSDNKIIAIGSSANDEFPETGTGVIARYMPDAHTSVSSTEHTSQEITIYPNPATDKIWISSQSYHQIDYAIVWTITGRQLVTQYNNNFIDVSCISAGTYFLKISMDKGKSIYSIPFIIHH